MTDAGQDSDELGGGGVPAAQRLVSAARRHLNMDLAFVAEFAGGRRIFRFVDAVPGAVYLKAGDSDLLADTYCAQIVDGTIPGAIPDATAEPSVCNLPVTAKLGIASYIGVPIRHPDGRVFGTLCCLAHVAHPELGDEQRRYLAMLAETIAAEIDQSPEFGEARQVRRNDVERTIADGEFFPVYQPVVDLRTGKVAGVEALTRFTADQRSPAAWFADASTVGLGVDLEIAAARAARSTFGNGNGNGMFLALNLSPSALGRADELMADAGSTPLVIELTEHSEIADYEVLRSTIDGLRSLSIQIAVDDTGAGIASLRHILELSPDIVKLDLSITLGIQTDPVRQALAHALAEFAAKVGTTVVAEGIESAEQLAVIAEVGIAFGQGFYLGRPAPLPVPDQVAVR